MSPKQQDAPGRRDDALARALTEALRAAGGESVGACPDAEVLAAYADRGLDAKEVAQWENHFAECSRCQKILAVLTVSDAPLAEEEVARLGELVASVSPSAEMGAAPVAAASANKAAQPEVAASHPPTRWRWLAPAVGVAAAVAFWFALRPARPGGTVSTVATSERSSSPALTGPASTPAPPGPVAGPPTGDTEMAQANVPPPPGLAAPPSAARGGASSASRSAQGNASASGAPGLSGGQAQGLLNEAQTPPAAETDHAALAPLAAPPSVQPPVTASDASPTVSAASGGPPAEPTAPAAAARNAPEAGIRSAFGVRALSQAKTAANVGPSQFASPDQSVQWRVGAAGRIERSTDQGRTWQPQSSGVTADLLSGAAVSNQAAWIVGKTGVILRTTDGEHWQRVASPNSGVPGGTAGGLVGSAPATGAPDWSSVEAQDALHATITSRDLRRFVTADGGRTWTPQ